MLSAIIFLTDDKLFIILGLRKILHELYVFIRLGKFIIYININCDCIAVLLINKNLKLILALWPRGPILFHV